MSQYFRTTIWVSVLFLSLTQVSWAKTIRFATTLGDFDVDLLEDDAPNTVQNFLSYVDRGDYDGTIVHRSVPGFVIQGGGYYGDYSPVVEQAPIQNEFQRSNTRGTLAMAKIGGDPDSATVQWFINLEDNSSILDQQNGGFTVFGEIHESGMQVVDLIAAVETTAEGGAFNELPMYQDSPISINSIRVVPEPTTSPIWLVSVVLLGFRRATRNIASE